MVSPRFEPGFDDRFIQKRDAEHGLAPDLSKVLVVGNSQINRIVVTKIVERCGLKPVSETAASAVRVLPLLFPGLVILDSGADNRECDGVVAGILALRRLSQKRLPCVIHLSNRTGGDTALDGVTDAVVTKPFTTEHLQPAVETLLLRMRG
jgi:CheY-like chemotaxis protein